MPQDLPPVGGYDPVQFRRNIPTKGFKPWYYLVFVAGIMSYGWYHLAIGQRERFEMSREKIWARIYLAPVMQAEEDRDQVRRYYADLAREKQLLGRETSVYNSKRFVRPTFAPVPKPTQ